MEVCSGSSGPGGRITPVFIPNLPLMIAALDGVHCGVAQQFVNPIPFSLRESKVGVSGVVISIPNPSRNLLPTKKTINEDHRSRSRPGRGVQRRF